ncbi:hypothetical protein HYH03_012323 [Edaphochlamys debaryana]|uniref:Uncharacterized protein n=1 Tax=Edaphochlamys debaryana TaxID=47281 RepID=A0A835XSY7_9CHLO|nr:hypothetical protein HYH03_012323 [Edaphochlamys debaryana]|eukprot:KAG2489097.1 hypothetical protein HYH03_012323 [Edaphochlamys debaryana]
MQNEWSLANPAPGSTYGTGRGTEGAGPGPGSLRSTAPASARAAAAAARAGGADSGMPVQPRTFATETKSNYAPPPADYRRAAAAAEPPSQMPRGNHPNDWSTSKQLDFRSDALQRLEPSRLAVHRDSGRILPTDVAPDSQFTSQSRTHFTGRTLTEARSIPPSGGRGTQHPGFNIITGAAPYGNNAFEFWDGRDYRRHR